MRQFFSLSLSESTWIPHHTSRKCVYAIRTFDFIIFSFPKSYFSRFWGNLYIFHQNSSKYIKILVTTSEMTIKSLWKIYKFSKNPEKYDFGNGKMKNRMYGYHKLIFSTCSEGFKSIQPTSTSENCEQLYQNMILIFYWWTLYGQGTTGISREMIRWLRYFPMSQ